VTHEEGGDLGPVEILAQGRPSASFNELPRVVTVGVTAGALVALVVVVMNALRPPPTIEVSRAPISGVSISVSTSGPSGRASPIIASYRVGHAPPGLRFAVTGLSGPFIRAAVVRADADLVTVTATPECDSAASLDPAPAPYLLAVSERADRGRSVTGRLDLPTSPVDWAAAVRRDCWQVLAATRLAVIGLRAEPALAVGPVELQVLLRNRSARSVRVRVLDIADVATVDPADSGVLRPGAQRPFRVRLPIADCGRGTGSQAPSLAWSVGPADADPLALLTTGLSPPQIATIQAAAALLCRVR
jgi:hypothetical protein